MEAARLTPREENAMNLHDGSRFQMMLRLSPQYYNSGAKTLRKFAKKNLRERQEAEDCLLHNAKTLRKIVKKKHQGYTKKLMQEKINNVNDMIHGHISPARFNTTKWILMKSDGKDFHALLGINDNENALPNDIGKYILCRDHLC
jgi:hypothetical protein